MKGQDERDFMTPQIRKGFELHLDLLFHSHAYTHTYTLYNNANWTSGNISPGIFSKVKFCVAMKSKANSRTMGRTAGLIDSGKL